MSIKVMTMVWDSDLGDKEKLLMLSLADWADDDGDDVFPSVGRMSYKTSLPERTIHRILIRLKDAGVLKVIREGTQHKPVEYKIVLEKIKPLPPFKSRYVKVADLNTDIPESSSAKNESQHCQALADDPSLDPSVMNEGNSPSKSRNPRQPKTVKSPTKRSRKLPKIDVTQDIVPWMVKMGGCLGHKAKLNSSPEATTTKSRIVDAEVSTGAAEFRQAWLDYLASGDWKDAKWPYSHFLAKVRSGAGYGGRSQASGKKEREEPIFPKYTGGIIDPKKGIKRKDGSLALPPMISDMSDEDEESESE